MNICGKFATAIIILILACGTAQATAMIKFDLSDLSLRADLIVRVSVISQSEAADAGTGRLHEYSKLKIIETIKGHCTAEITVRQVAQQKNGKYATIVTGQPRIEKGAEYLLFLMKKGDLYFILGMSQGHYALIENKGKLLAVRNLYGVSLYDKQGKITLPPESEAAITTIEYSLLRQKIMNILKTAESGPQ